MTEDNARLFCSEVWGGFGLFFPKSVSLEQSRLDTMTELKAGAKKVVCCTPGAFQEPLVMKEIR